MVLYYKLSFCYGEYFIVTREFWVSKSQSSMFQLHINVRIWCFMKYNHYLKDEFWSDRGCSHFATPYPLVYLATPCPQLAIPWHRDLVLPLPPFNVSSRCRKIISKCHFGSGKTDVIMRYMCTTDVKYLIKGGFDFLSSDQLSERERENEQLSRWPNEGHNDLYRDAFSLIERI